MKKQLYGFLNVGWTILYFVYWGGFYGVWMGLVMGTAILPIFGTVMGTFSGLFIGMGVGSVIGLGIAMFHSLFFEHDTNLDLYRRRLARGVLVLILGLGVLGIGFLFIEQGTSFLGVFEWLFILSAVLGSLGSAALSMAYATYYYPDEMIKRLIQQEELSLDDSNTLLEKQTATEQMEAFLTRIYPWWMYVIASVITMAIGMAVAGLMGLIAGVSVGVLGLFAFALFCAIGNSFLIVFLKTVLLENFFPDMSPHRYRVTLTLFAFAFTLITTWWSLIFAPLTALYIAYHVYHTLALPDGGFEKAKRKEKYSAG